ncbi:MAG: ribosome biogenesis GTPase Der [Bacteroidales bacterium]|jgi:GTP-binding protein|nr:ribosome biogenesis GTPase Der [Bacteroidales bacterium]NCU35547.1 ribosome biogenesis GTPase Der [Candidatus Falkowbacteria bacterium]MDD3526741.1 ribosome biogenesis GTPase Der [Bacteroidales bacterium]MDD4178162.1 ribosome biogenesis GTPase Der [Bacteroidales bacterium]MDD4742389.1 ribosome biogenesis GTPase Der [Bacteroidales bacterium]
MANILAIVGRPNVGKSTLFNRLTGQRAAIVEETSGVTRDRHYGQSDWNGKRFSVVDTGGYVIGSDDIFEEEIRKQVDLAMQEADVILMVVDAREGLTALDEDVANILRRSPKKVFVAVNKVDIPKNVHEIAEFYSMGLDQLFPVSAINGAGTGELLDEIVKHFQDIPDDNLDDLPRFAVIGRPNVGKSSFINALLGDDRNIVTDIPGTTRDAVNTRYNSFGFDFYLVDTAGLRRKSRVHENIEFYSVMRSIRAIENSDVCLLMVDATTGFEAQDINILHLIEKNRKAVVMVVNKWDLIEKGTNTHLDFENEIRKKTAPFTDYSIVFTSVIKKQRIFKALEAANEAFQNSRRRIATSKLNEVLLPIIESSPPPVFKGKYVKIKYVTQLPTKFPAFAFYCNSPQYVKEPYLRFMENTIRKHFDFKGIPVQLYFRNK